MTQNTYELFLRDEEKRIIAQLEAFTSFICIHRYNLAGTWVMTGGTDTLATLSKNMGIVVRRNGEDFFSGVVGEFEDENGIDMSTNGYSDEDHLAGSLAYPVPAGAPYTVDYDVRTGIAETIIKQYVNLNAGPGASPSRQISGLTLETDLARGTSVTGRARFDNLMTLINSLATQGGVGFRVLDMEFQVYSPEDKSGAIVFSSELQTLGAYTYKEKRGKVNHVIVGGAGTGSARTFIEVSNSESILGWGRRELFIDQSNTSSSVELTAAANEELEKEGDTVSLTFAPIVTEAMRPFDDYGIGDWVTGVIRGVPIVQQVREIKTTINGSGAEAHEIAIGTEGATTDQSTLARVYERMRGIDKRVGIYEKR